MGSYMGPLWAPYMGPSQFLQTVFRWDQYGLSIRVIYGPHMGPLI